MPVKKTETAEEKMTQTAIERALKCAELAYDKKAYDICVRDISRVSSIADYMVIISGSSDKQNQAIADNIRTGLKKYGKVNDIEGANDGRWIVMDYGDVLVHIFHDQIRRYYDLDGLWGMAPALELRPEIKAARKESDY